MSAGSRSIHARIGGAEVSPEDLLAQAWDYVIVGGGSAGGVLANRLTALPDVRVLLLEAGPTPTDPAIFAPPAWPGLAGGEYDWRYQSVPQSGLLGRRVAQPRGKGLGGSTLINALGFQRGPLQAYDEWAAATGDPGWGGQALLPYFKRLETASTGADEWRGGDGPLQVLEIGHVADRNALSRAYADASVEAGFPFNPDWNGANADGTIWTQLTIRGGRRDTAATAYLDPVWSRANLGIVTGAKAQRIHVASGRCSGVELEVAGHVHILAPARETILCAGAIDTPRLLLLSGIGPAAELAATGIQPVHDLPGVGRELRDHPLVPGLLFASPQSVPASRYNHCETMTVTCSRDASNPADIQLMALTVPFLSPELGAAPPDSFSVVPALLRPRSCGTLRLASADPAIPPLIDPAYLTDEQDVDALVDAFEIAREVMAQPALGSWVDREVFPGPRITAKAALADHIRLTASPFFHPVATCRMGLDRLAVTDATCRVRGIAGLRIVDASIMPTIPRAMTNAAVLALAERAADLIGTAGHC